MENKYKIVKYESKLRQKIVDFLKSVAIDEFGFLEWKDYLENKDFSSYEKGESVFLVVIDEDENIIATCGGLKVDNETIKLNSMYVEKAHRRQRLATLLFDMVINFAKENGFKFMILCTYEKYKIAKKFYEDRGFRLYKKEGIELWCRKKIGDKDEK